MGNKYLPALVCGFAVSIFTTIPGIKSLVCCLFLPASVFLTITLYKKANKIDQNIPIGTGLMLGFLTGIFAAAFSSGFDILLTLILRSNDFVTAMPETEKAIRELNLGPMIDESLKLMKQMVSQIQQTGFSFFYCVLITISNLISYIIFGLLGGAISTAIFNKRNLNS